ncbi:head-tail connector protein [Sphingomonas pituitosa]|uniref:head-tail connector protein n=1 Tax=Sphingomonas pituitosa TaxID=99597 RepID=UPI000A064C07|nr:head-tail connector protein [Sphingomonas pituitosa]
MTIEEMRAAAGLADTATEAEVVAAYAALIDDGRPVSLPIVEPVTVEQVRLHCKIEEDEEDALIAQKIRAAREWVEDYTDRIVAQRTLVQHFRGWAGALALNSRPVVSIDSVTYDGTEGPAALARGAFTTSRDLLRIHPDGSGWPQLRAGGGVTVAYTAGYDAGEAPNCMTEAIIVLVAGMLNERAGSYDAAERAAERLLARLVQFSV